jgi:hypothetical protein
MSETYKDLETRLRGRSLVTADPKIRAAIDEIADELRACRRSVFAPRYSQTDLDAAMSKAASSGAYQMRATLARLKCAGCREGDVPRQVKDEKHPTWAKILWHYAETDRAAMCPARDILETLLSDVDSGLDQPLSAAVEGQQLVIRVGAATLAFAFEHSDDAMNLFGPGADGRRRYRVADKLKFARAVVDAMNDETAGGDTFLQAFVEQQFRSAAEDGNGGTEQILRTKL